MTAHTAQHTEAMFSAPFVQGIREGTIGGLGNEGSNSGNHHEN